MKKKYLLRLKKQDGGYLNYYLKYNEHGDLYHVEFRDLEESMTAAQRGWIWQFIPKTIEELEVRRKVKGVKITEVEMDLSFDAFWNLYAYKVGNKKRAKVSWDKLDDATRLIVLQKVKEYQYFLKHKSYDMVFPERFLSEKRYENDYKLSS